MKHLLKKRVLKSYYVQVFIIFIVFGLSFTMTACGGGGSSNNNNGTEPGNVSENPTPEQADPQVIDPELAVVINSIETDECPTVKVYVSIADENNELIEDNSDLTVQLYEDGAQQTDNFNFQWQGNIQSPISVVFAMDYSLSMSSKAVRDMENGVKAFVDAMAPEDQAAIIKFYYEPQLMVGLTSDKAALYNAVDTSPESRDYTNIYDTVVEAVDVLEGVDGRLAVILLTDGAHMVIDDYPVHNTLADAIDNAKQNNVSVFSIALDLRDDAEIKDISEETGGIFYPVLDSSVVTNVYLSLYELLDKQHLITYTSSSTDGLEHSIQIFAEYGDITGQSVIQNLVLCPAP